MFAVALAKVTWISQRRPLCIVGVVEVKVKGLILEALALEIAQIVSH